MDQSSDTERRHWFAQVDLHPTSAGQQEGRSLTPSACTPSSCPACSEGCDCHVPPCPSALPVVLARSLVFGGCSSCPCWLQSDGRQGPQQGSASPSLPSMCSTSRLRTLIVLLDRQEGTQIRWIPAVSQVLGDLLFLHLGTETGPPTLLWCIKAPVSVCRGGWGQQHARPGHTAHGAHPGAGNAPHGQRRPGTALALHMLPRHSLPVPSVTPD